jgi:hypothetical protein
MLLAYSSSLTLHEDPSIKFFRRCGCEAAKENNDWLFGGRRIQYAKSIVLCRHYLTDFISRNVLATVA